MRKPLLIALIAATALVPVAASAQEWQGRGRARADAGAAQDGQRPRGEARAAWRERQVERTQQAAPAEQPRAEQPRVERPRMERQSVERPRAEVRTDVGVRAPDRAEFRNRARFAEGQARPERPDTEVTRPAPVNPRAQADFGNARADYDRDRRWDRAAGQDPRGNARSPQVRDDRNQSVFGNVLRNRVDDARRDDARRIDDRNRNDDRRRADNRNLNDGRNWNDGRNLNNGRNWNDNRNWNNGRVSNDRRDWRGDDRSGNQRWNRNWRGDNRYDWQNFRQRNRQAYRLPRYYAPQGYNYGYQRFSIGLTLGSMLYSRNYWIADPWQYRLPEVYGPYRWVRYYNDALLVDIYSGEVVDVINEIFW